MENEDMAHHRGLIMEEKAVNIMDALKEIGDKEAESSLTLMTNADTIPDSGIKMTIGHRIEIRNVTGTTMTADSAAIAEIWDQTGAADKIWTIMTVTGDPETNVPGKGREEDHHGTRTATRNTAVDRFGS